MHALALEGVEVGRGHRRQGLALAGLHLHDLAVMEDYAAEHLGIERTLAQYAPRRFAGQCEGFRKGGVQCFSSSYPGFDFGGLQGKFFRLERHCPGFAVIDRMEAGKKCFDITLALGAEDCCQGVECHIG